MHGRKHMDELNDWDKVSLAFDILENAEVMQEFDTTLWIQVDRALWEAFCEEGYNG
jgi:hypothetical protein